MVDSWDSAEDDVCTIPYAAFHFVFRKYLFWNYEHTYVCTKIEDKMSLMIYVLMNSNYCTLHEAYHLVPHGQPTMLLQSMWKKIATVNSWTKILNKGTMSLNYFLARSFSWAHNSCPKAVSNMARFFRIWSSPHGIFDRTACPPPPTKCN